MLRRCPLPQVVVVILTACLIAITAQAAAEAAPLPAGESRPTVTIRSPQDGALVTERRVELALHAKNPGDETLEIQVLVEGRPAQLARAVEVVHAASAADDETTHRVAVLIPAQHCVVTVHAVTSHAKSEPAVLRLRWQGASPKAAKPKLYVLAVGVTEYELPELQLRYPAKDARDLATVFTEQAGTLYGAVESRILTDRDATRASVLDGLQWLERQTTARARLTGPLWGTVTAGVGAKGQAGVHMMGPILNAFPSLSTALECFG